VIEKVGDFWAETGDAHVITTNGTIKTNGACVMGRGVALQARNRFPGIDKFLGTIISEKGNHVHSLGEWTRADGATHHIFSFPVKINYWENATLAMIRYSVRELVIQVPPAFQKVVMVRPGCGNGNLVWDVVREELRVILNDRFVIVERNA